MRLLLLLAVELGLSDLLRLALLAVELGPSEVRLVWVLLLLAVDLGPSELPASVLLPPVGMLEPAEQHLVLVLLVAYGVELGVAAANVAFHAGMHF